MIAEITIYKQGEKINNARKLLEITQSELANDTLTQNVISLLETEKLLLSYHYARLLIEKIEQISKEKGIELNFNNTTEYWMGNEGDQAEGILKSYLEELEKYESNPIDEEFNKLILSIENLCTNYKVSEESRYKTNKKIYKIYHSQYKWSEGNQYLRQCYGIANYNRNNEELLELLCDLVRSYLNLEHYKDAINCEQQINLVLENAKTSDYELKIYYNLALAYIYSNEFEKALNLLGKIKTKNLPMNSRQRLMIDSEEATCYKDLGKYEEAVEKYLSIINNKDYLSFHRNINTIYHNLLEIELERKNMEKVEEYFEILDLLQKDTINSYKYIMYSIVINKLEYTYNSFVQTINELNKINATSKIDELIEKVFNYWINKNDTKMIDDLIIKLEEAAANKIITKEKINNLLADVANYYRDIDATKALYYLNKRDKIKSLVFGC